MTRRSRDRRRATALATLASAAVWFVLLQPTTGIAEEMVIGSIDMYGLRKVSEADIRKALGFEVGGPGPVSESEVIERLESVPGVARADLEGICCGEDGTILVYVGIEETPASKREYRPDPVSEVELPAEIAETYQEFFDAFEKAILKGDMGDDLSQGHSLMNNPAIRRVQERFIVLADKHMEKLRE